MNNKSIIGIRLNTALAQNGMMQKELAAQLEVTDNTISYFCSGKRIPNTSQLIKISKILHVSTDYLLGITPVSSQDIKVKSICEYTGLSENAVQSLNKLKTFRKELLPFISFMIENNHIYHISDMVSPCIRNRTEAQKCENDAAKSTLLSNSTKQDFVNRKVDTFIFNRNCRSMSKEEIELREKTGCKDEEYFRGKLENIDTEYMGLLWSCEKIISNAVRAYVIEKCEKAKGDDQ